MLTVSWCFMLVVLLFFKSCMEETLVMSKKLQSYGFELLLYTLFGFLKRETLSL